MILNPVKLNFGFVWKKIFLCKWPSCDKGGKKMKCTDFDGMTLPNSTELKCKYWRHFYCTCSPLAQRIYIYASHKPVWKRQSFLRASEHWNREVPSATNPLEDCPKCEWAWGYRTSSECSTWHLLRPRKKRELLAQRDGFSGIHLPVRTYQ